MPKRKPLTDDEKKIIQDKAGVYTDLEIGQMINRSRRTIAHYRKSVLGVEAANVREKQVDPLSMDDERRMKFFKKHLENDHFWDQIKDQLTEPEMDFYMSEWASLCIQFQDIVATERRQIHDLIMAEILDGRLLKSIKFVRDEIDELVAKVEVFRKTHNIDDDTDAAETEQAFTDLLAHAASESKAIGDQHEKLLKQKNNILEHLNGRRKDRISQIKEAKENIIGFIEGMKDKKIRESMARFAKAHKVATDRLEEKWKGEEFNFPDGKKDSILKTLN